MNGIDVKIERIRHGVKQYRLAAALGLPQTTLCAIENGRRPVPHQDALAIQQAILVLAGQASPKANDDRAA